VVKSAGASANIQGAQAHVTGAKTSRARPGALKRRTDLLSQQEVKEFQHIKLRYEARVARITFARPPLNIFNIAMMREIDRAINEIMVRRDVVAIVFDAVAESRAWSAGVAVEEHAAELIYQMLEAFHAIFRSLEEAAKPTVALVNGAALGGGCELVAACDIVIAVEGTRFGQQEIKLGVFPPIAAILLPRIISEKRARELILTGELIGASEAAQLGLVSHVVATPEAMEAKAQEILMKLREMSAPALEATRRALNAAQGQTFDAALDRVEDLYLNDLMKTEDAEEGINAFREKRKPVWRNR
jgi:cyclohexa-1,5-dienecarbonyl-CoA hydratase